MTHQIPQVISQSELYPRPNYGNRPQIQEYSMHQQIGNQSAGTFQENRSQQNFSAQQQPPHQPHDTTTTSDPYIGGRAGSSTNRNQLDTAGTRRQPSSKDHKSFHQTPARTRTSKDNGDENFAHEHYYDSEDEPPLGYHPLDGNHVGIDPKHPPHMYPYMYPHLFPHFFPQLYPFYCDNLKKIMKEKKRAEKRRKKEEKMRHQMRMYC
jgi:hypothetical protein